MLLFARNARVTGLDLKDSLLEFARDRLRATGGSERVTLQVGDNFKIPFPPQTFDLVWSSHYAARANPRGGRLGLCGLGDASRMRCRDPIHIIATRLCPCGAAAQVRKPYVPYNVAARTRLVSDIISPPFSCSIRQCSVSLHRASIGTTWIAGRTEEPKRTRLWYER